jgi:hypothetical protein
MDTPSGADLNDPFEAAIDDALSSLLADLRAAMSNVEIVVEDKPPDGQPLLGLSAAYRCREGAARTAECFPKISIFGGPICRRRGSSTPRGQARRAP